jgi:hypothetical protein
MLPQHPLWKMPVALAVAVALFMAARPVTIISAAATLAAAAGLAGLVLCAKRGNIGSIWRSIAWSLAGGVAGTALSPSPPFHPPLEFVFGGILCGWALGCVFVRTGTVSQSRPVPPKWRSLLWLALGLVFITQLFEPHLLFFAWRMGTSTTVVIALGAFVRTVSAVPLVVYLFANMSLGREVLRSYLLLCVMFVLVLSVFTTEVPFMNALLQCERGMKRGHH